MRTKQFGDYIIRVESIDKTFDNGVVALKDFSTNIRRSEVVVLIGPSGSGKSTFLRCLNGLEEIDSGSMSCSSISVKPWKCTLKDCEKITCRSRNREHW